MDCSPPGSSVQGILQARILEWLPFPSRGDLLDPGIEPSSLMSLALAGGFFTTEPSGRPVIIFPAMCPEGAGVRGVETGQQDAPSLDPH